ncbi:MAG: UDP-N-acetylmuramoyl-tripeptide--D-alanyl-D-alanine ligase [Fibrobacterota bacterium]
MRPVNLDKFAAWMGVSRDVNENLRDLPLPDIWMDSRKIQEGDMFLALEGEARDGHEYISAAFENGACAAVVAEKKRADIPSRHHSRLLCVDDPLAAVAKAAREYRNHLDIPVIAVTGSNGKTTTARFLYALLSQKYRVGRTRENWNNHIGVPLSLLRLQGDEDMAVFELGANHRFEIAENAAIVRPDMGVITNIGYAHVGYFGGIEKTVEAKFELAEVVQSLGGTLYLNGDDRRIREYRNKKGFDSLYFGLSENVDIRGEDPQCKEDGTYTFRFRGSRFHLPMPGRHFMYALLPALELAFQLGISKNDCRAALKKLTPGDMRGEIVTRNEIIWIVDCYNSNPSSMDSAMKLLCDYPTQGGRRVVIAGDMHELEEYSEKLHRWVGERAVMLGIDMLVALGDAARGIYEGARDAGMDEASLVYLKSLDEMKGATRILTPGDVVLLKGSRAAGMERILDFFPEKVQ